MTRHSFIQMSKLYNVKGRISYITSHARQENLYATYRTADNSFWSNLAKECQQEFRRSGADGKCIEARELIIALPEVYTTYEPQQVLEDFTDEFRRRYEGDKIKHASAATLVQHIVQGTARDILTDSIRRLTDMNLKIVMHVHDEVVIEAPSGQFSASQICRIISESPPWASDLPLGAEGFECEYYRKN